MTVYPDFSFFIIDSASCRSKHDTLSTKEDTLKNVVTRKLMAAIDFQSMENKYYESQWVPSTVFG